MFDKYGVLCLYIRFSYSVVCFLFLVDAVRWIILHSTDQLFVRAILFVCCGGASRFLEVGNARFFLCLSDTDSSIDSFLSAESSLFMSEGGGNLTDE